MIAIKYPFLTAVPALAMAAALTACSPSDDKAGAAKTTDGTEIAAQQDSAAAKASLVEQTDETLDFAYGYPAEAAAIPALAAKLDADREKIRASAASDAAQGMADAKANDYPVRQHIAKQIWQKVADTPRFLSLSAEAESYTGGAHGLIAFAAMLWDRQKNAEVDPKDIFTSASAFDLAVKNPFCAGIIAAKKKKGVEIDTSADSVFDLCPRASEQTVWLGSSDGKTLNRMTIAIGPYVVGPYVEGVYHIDIPITPEIARVVKPEYADAVTSQSQKK